VKVRKKYISSGLHFIAHPRDTLLPSGKNLTEKFGKHSFKTSIFKYSEKSIFKGDTVMVYHQSRRNNTFGKKSIKRSSDLYENALKYF
jgi:hypothetical protein